jgi:hypothetical protein
MRLNISRGAMVVVFASTGWAQITNYLGPGILSRGAGDIGSRGGEQVDLRFSASVSGIVDSGLLPISVDSSGHIPDFATTYGVEARLGAYGTHRWKRALLGLDYQGNYRYYTDNRYFNGSDQALTLGYTVQPSRRLIVDMRGTGGTVSYANTGLYNFATESFNPATSQIFDSRADFVQGSMDFTYLKSARTYFEWGGYGFKVDHRNKALIGVNGYDLRGSINHRLSRETTIGVTYDHSHFDYPRAFGESDINMYQGYWARSLGKNWTLRIAGGVFQVETQGLQMVALDPAVVEILGVTQGIQAYYRKNTLPSGEIVLTRRFKSAQLSANYTRTLNPGNGLYLSSRMENAGLTLDYRAGRKWTFSGTGIYQNYTSIGQNLYPYRGFGGGAGAAYALTGALHAVVRYDARHQEIVQTNGFTHTSYRVSLGLAFSPGDLPLSLW